MKIFEAAKFLLKSSAYKIKYKKPKVMNSEQTLDYILKNKCSIARFGDGELSLIEGRSIRFQSYNEELAKKLKEIKTNEKCLVCIPNVFNKDLNKKQIVKEEYSFWKKSNLVFGGMWNKYFHNQNILGDAFISRFYMRYADKSNISDYVNKLKLLWDNRNIVFVEGEQSRLGVGNDLFNNAKTIKRIICPSVNAYDKYNEILDTIKNNVNKEDLIILALGPTATVLAYELSTLNYSALDLGHIDIEYEWFKMGATKKVPVKNKHVNECYSLGGAIEKEFEQQYLSEIVGKV